MQIKESDISPDILESRKLGANPDQDDSAENAFDQKPRLELKKMESESPQRNVLEHEGDAGILDLKIKTDDLNLTQEQP